MAIIYKLIPHLLSWFGTVLVLLRGFPGRRSVVTATSIAGFALGVTGTVILFRSYPGELSFGIIRDVVGGVFLLLWGIAVAAIYRSNVQEFQLFRGEKLANSPITAGAGTLLTGIVAGAVCACRLSGAEGNALALLLLVLAAGALAVVALAAEKVLPASLTVSQPGLMAAVVALMLFSSSSLIRLDLFSPLSMKVMKFAHDFVHQFFESMLIPDHLFIRSYLWGYIGLLFGKGVGFWGGLIIWFTPVALILLAIRFELLPSVAHIRQGAQRRKLLAAAIRERRFRLVIPLLALLVFAAAAYRSNFPSVEYWDPKPVPVSANPAGEIFIPKRGEIDLEDGQLHKYLFKQGGKEVRFFVLLTPAGQLTVDLDACAICKPDGYGQAEGTVLCYYCKTLIPLETVGKPGGCNPVPVPFTVKEDGVRIDGLTLVNIWGNTVQATVRVKEGGEVKRLLNAIWTVLSSRALPPLVCGVFLLTYIAIAFGTDDTLTALMEFTRKSVILAVILALIPLNSLCRIILETDRHLKRRRAMNGQGPVAPAELFNETVSLPLSPVVVEPLHPTSSQPPVPDSALPVSPAFAELEVRLGAVGYRCRRTEITLAAWRGISIFPARLLFLVGTFCLFAGILISLTARTTHRMNVVEGEPLPTAKGGGGLVERISLKASSGAILDKILTLEVASSAAGDGGKVFGLYPPSLYRGYFVYPRYLGITPVIRFSAPDMQSVYEKRTPLHIYPPGNEDRLEIPGSPYQIVLSMAAPDDGSDPYMTGRITFNFKLLKGKELLVVGSVPAGGEIVREGYRLAVPDFKRMVITDFILDYGVLLVWAAAILFIGALCIGLPARVLFPRREILFTSGADAIQACSRAEGGRRRHGGVFHEALDLFEARRPDGPGTAQPAIPISARELHPEERTKD